MSKTAADKSQPKGVRFIKILSGLDSGLSQPTLRQACEVSRAYGQDVIVEIIRSIVDQTRSNAMPR
jgi:hypothetical protein